MNQIEQKFKHTTNEYKENNEAETTTKQKRPKIS